MWPCVATARTSGSSSAPGSNATTFAVIASTSAWLAAWAWRSAHSGADTWITAFGYTSAPSATNPPV